MVDMQWLHTCRKWYDRVNRCTSRKTGLDNRTHNSDCQIHLFFLSAWRLGSWITALWARFSHLYYQGSVCFIPTFSISWLQVETETPQYSGDSSCYTIGPNFIMKWLLFNELNSQQCYILYIFVRLLIPLIASSCVSAGYAIRVCVCIVIVLKASKSKNMTKLIILSIHLSIYLFSITAYPVLRSQEGRSLSQLS